MIIFRKNVLLYILFFIILISGYAKAEMPASHKPVPCIGCHQETLGADSGIGECGNCHYYGLDVDKLQTEHNPKICTICHIGNTTANGDEREIFHNGHTAVNCTQCHVEDNFTVLKIKNDGFKCVSCHGTEVHSIHAKNLGKSCKICHGSWAAGKVYQGEGVSSSTNSSGEKERLERFTIFNFIRNLFNALLGLK
ncbi:hypothetical protein MNV_660030 [Candidatus Methanoperedens nitroreducens]|uniref:Uncharacterized protein n=1 Tax=Candidatus Methanoperedens nitratireducens TaxID=1392998 RepID=A0A284VSP6_9EURY|nr:hypothetical protein MNV_660030 [Candidatus Methanoperedens nitroreducens]